MKITIVGSSGFVGQHLVERLISNTELLCIGSSNNLRMNYKSIAELSPEELNESSYIIFCHSQKKNIYDEFDYLNSKNAVETILGMIDPHLKMLRGLVYLSSFAVYRGYRGGEISEETPINYSRNDFYAHTKFTEERIISDFASRIGIDHLILRLPGLVGPGVHGNLFYKIAVALKNNDELILHNKNIPFNVLLEVETVVELIYDFVFGLLASENQMILLGAADIVRFELIVEMMKSKVRSSSKILWGLSELRGPSVVKISNRIVCEKYLKRIYEILYRCDDWIAQ